MLATRFSDPTCLEKVVPIALIGVNCARNNEAHDFSSNGIDFSDWFL